VPTEFFVDSTTKKSSKEIVYLGRSKSSGVDNNLNLIIEALEILGEKESRKFSVSMIGIFPDEFGQTWDLGFIKGGRKTDLNVKFFPNLKHEDIVGKLRGTAIGIVPYSYNTYHSQRFPIKILEYAASRNLIVASDVYQKNGILDETTALFFDATSSLSLVKALGRALNQDQKHIIDNAQRWARNYTYDMRASKLITIFANDK
jgi:hypothetical protein